MTIPRSPQDVLIQTYQTAYQRVLDDLISAAQADRSPNYYQAILSDIERILTGLDSNAQSWIEQQLPAVYRGGMQAAVDGA